MSIVPAVAGLVFAAGFDPGVEPNGDAPWFGWFQHMGGSVIGTLVVAAAVMLALGIVVALVGRFVSSSKAQAVGIGGIVIGLIGVILLGGVPELVRWLTSQTIF